LIFVIKASKVDLAAFIPNMRLIAIGTGVMGDPAVVRASTIDRVGLATLAIRVSEIEKREKGC